MTYNEAAAGFFYEGYNCAQATALAFSDVLGMRKEELIRITAGFGAGMGGLRRQCGAVSAMVCIAGIVKGGYQPNDNAAKKELYDTVKAMNAAFIERFGTTCCRELLAKASVFAGQDPSERTEEYYRQRPCVRFVEAASEIIVAQLLRNDGKTCFNGEAFLKENTNL